MSADLAPIRIVFVLQDLDFGGAQRQALELASRLDKGRFASEIWVLQSGGGFVPWAQELGLPLIFFSSGPHVGPASLWKLWKQLRRHRPDVVMPFTAVPNIWCRILGRFASLPLIVGTCRGGGSIRRQREGLLWRLAHHHICNAASLRQTLLQELGIPENRVSFIPNGIATAADKLHGGLEAGHNVLNVGRLVSDKDHGTLIRAFADVIKAVPDARLTIVGNGPLLAEHQELARSFGLADVISFLPARLNVGRAYAECSVFALSSITEALPNVLMEAAAVGKPVVATNVGDVSKLVRHKFTGLLVEPGAPEEMAEALIGLLGNPIARQEMGVAGQAHIAGLFGMEQMVQSYETLFFSLIMESRG